MVRIEPSVLPVGQLPARAVIFGENLRLAAKLSLDDRQAAELELPQVSFDGVNATWVSYQGTDRLDVLLPASLTPGTHDVSVEFDPRSRLVLPSGLRIVGDEVDSSAATSEQSVVDSGAESANEPSTAVTASGEASSRWTSSSRNGGLDASSPPDGSRGSDDGFECEPGEFGPPEQVVVSGYSGARPWSPTLSSDYSTLYFTDASRGSEVLWTATRSDRGATFAGSPTNHSMFSSGGIGTPYVSPDGASLYFYSNQSNGAGGGDLYLAQRLVPSGDFGYPLALTGLNSTGLDYLPWVSPDELTIVFVSDRSGSSAYYTASRSGRFEAFREPALLPKLTHTQNNGRISISRDGLRAYFTSRNRPGGRGLDDVWYATRESPEDEFDDVTNLGVVNTPGSETQVTLTQDGQELYFIAMGATSSRIFRSLATCR